MTKVTPQELSELLNGFNVEDKFTRNIVKIAKDNKLVIVATIGDDTVTFSGAITDEFDMFHGGKIFLQKEDNEFIPYTRNNEAKTRKSIEVFWDKHSLFKWKFLTLIKHTTYDLKRGGRSFCKGIIFNLNDI
jgi:hypothetical protein